MHYKKIRRSFYILGFVATTGLLTGCGESDLLKGINNGQEIEIEVASPDFEQAEQGTESQLLWEQLASLETNETLRKAWDSVLKVTVTETGKNGPLYVNVKGENENNNTLAVALHNRAFAKLFETEEGVASLAEGALNNYVDLDAENEYKAALMGVNGYFNLIPDMEVAYANPDSTLTRTEFLSTVFRAETPVGVLESDGVYTNAVGQSDYNLYAQGVAKDSYLDLESKSLNNMTANGSISRAEVIYTLVSRYFADELATVDLKTTDIKLTDAKDGGKIGEQQKFIEDGVQKTYWKSYELTYALSNPDGGLPTDLYKALIVANKVGILQDTETRWDEAATRSEIIEFIINAHINDDSIETFNFQQGTISGYEVTDPEESTSTNSSGVNSTHEEVIFEEGEYRGDDEVVEEGPRGEDHQTTYDANGDGVLDQADNEMVNSIVDKLLDKYGDYTGSGSGSTSGSGASSGGDEVDHSKDFGDKGFSGLVPTPDDPSKTGNIEFGSGDYTGLEGVTIR